MGSGGQSEVHAFGSAFYLLTHHLLVISLYRLLSDGRVVFLW